jgi:glycosyltransferase involved in cell wall biosynthesis
VRVGFALLTLFPGRVGGSETYVRGLLDAFADGHGPERVTVLGNRHVLPAYRDAGRGPVDIHHVRSYRPGDRDWTRSLAIVGAALAPRRVDRDIPPGLDLLHYPVTIPIPRPRAPHVVTVHDLQHHDLPEFFGAAERRYRAIAYDRSARRATLVITPSQASREGLARVGVHQDRVEVIPLGIDHARFRPDPGPEDEAVLEQLGLPDRFLFYPANLWPHKNHERLVEAFARAEDSEVSLVLSGQTYGRLGAFNARARQLGVGDRVRHLGHVPSVAMAPLYRRAVALVFPSLYEGFGSPPVEAMACGCPVAASRRGSLAEVCGEAVLEFDPEEVESIAATINRIATDSELRGDLRRMGLVRAADFGWERAAERHRLAYERALRMAPA